ncbi:MAG: potassium transporter Kup [Gemmatimonadaceae bacterium]
MSSTVTEIGTETSEYAPVHTPDKPTGARLGKLTLLALGVVYGDIGTSPLYAFREAFRPEYGLERTPANVYGVISLIMWALILTVSVKYIIFIMRADNRGEGGILALLALLLRQRERLGPRWRAVIVALGLIGAALLYGDGVITPAITVLGAVEGLEVVSRAFRYLVIPASVLILIGLFLVQKRGTAQIGRVFGPIMLLWFVTIGGLGIAEIMRQPHILAALNPWYGVQLFMAHGWYALPLLGAVVLAITGAEALYADMGHFGKRPIRVAWFVLVIPSLLLNYFGQGALVIESAAGAENPFYLLAPRILLYPLIILATAAAVIASQALISGAFSLTQQSVQLGYSPRVNIVHTSGEEAGQIYVPEVNTALMIGCVVMVLAFRSSAALSAAYGIAVTGTMVITTILFTELARIKWNWKPVQYLCFAAFFLAIDLAFFVANVLKIEHGGWVPLAIGGVIFVLMTTWHRGRRITRALLHKATLPLEDVLTSIRNHGITRVPGTAVFMSADSSGAPMVLLHHLKHNKALHQQVILLTVGVKEVPEVADSRRMTVTELTDGFWRIVAQYGFMQTPDVKQILSQASRDHNISIKPMDTTYYLGRERLLPIGDTNFARWRKKLFVFMSRNSRPATDFFGLPPNRVIELGAQLEI